MRQIVLITLAFLTIFATAATAHQNGWGNGHMRGNSGNMHQSGVSGNGCGMRGNMGGGANMMNGNQGMNNQVQQGMTQQNWRVNPSYQGQVPVVSGKDI